MQLFDTICLSALRGIGQALGFFIVLGTAAMVNTYFTQPPSVEQSE